MKIAEKIIENLPALPSPFNFLPSTESLRQCHLDIANASLHNSGSIKEVCIACGKSSIACGKMYCLRQNQENENGLGVNSASAGTMQLAYI